MYRQPFKGDYPITLDYGEKFEPLYTDESPHRGIDYGCPEGTEILASNDGTVIYTGTLTVGYGKYVQLLHDGGYSTFYAHLSAILVREGQAVSIGQVIGLSGNTGNSTGPHLHFEVRKNGHAVDPKAMLQSVFDGDPISSTPEPEKPTFKSLHSGTAVVVCDVANVRCHCDMSRVMGQLKRGDIIAIGDQVTMYNGLPFRDFWDPRVSCWLRIAEHDPTTQMLENYEV